MATIRFDLPFLYGDHHVLEVRRLLSEMPGVLEVYASSCFQLVEVSYDPTLVDADAIESTLSQAGYLQDLMLPTEKGLPAYGIDEPGTFLRHTAAYTPVKQVVSFAQRVPYSGAPLWPCPGIGLLQKGDE
ncbi:MAG: heavy-metal-associated domain-containing protein [Chloroflexi bacterium]|nr:heavy-metal-associated domain-containing protein [Chloroflexota bacterium]